MTLQTRKISVDVYYEVVLHSLASNDVKEVQHSISKTTLPVYISVLSSSWQQFQCSVDFCHVNGHTQWEYL